MQTTFVPFEKLPYSDTCWSLIEGPDEKAYAAACSEHFSGGTAYIVRYDPESGEMEYLIDVAEVTGDLPENGRPTQCKVHDSMVVTDEGILYAATHLSGPAIDQVHYSPWAAFDDPVHSFSGAKLFAYDLGKEKVLWVEELLPWEGCRCLALDEKRGVVYFLGYPRDHFYCFDLQSRQLKDLGRVGSVNSQVIWTDNAGRAYVVEDFGCVLVCEEPGAELTDTGLRTPHATYQSGWHNVAYDAVKVPERDAVVGAGWNVDPHLFFLDHNDGNIRDLGAAKPEIASTLPRGLNDDHAGGLVFAANGDLLFTVTMGGKEGWKYDRNPCRLRRLNLNSGKSEDVAELIDQHQRPVSYISRAVRIGRRHYIGGMIGRVPSGILHVELEGEITEGKYEKTPRRFWG